MALHEVFELDHELVLFVEELEAAFPVFNVEIGFLMWVEFGEDLLDELGGDIEPL